jgi:hypothetical protein
MPSKNARLKMPKSKGRRASKLGLPQTSGSKDTGTEEESSEKESAGISDDDFKQIYCSSPPPVTSVKDGAIEHGE